ncbi:MAG: EF-P lysine aminoacylase GenX [Methylovulum sp.]|nr:EF-P lysine aminoacylase GenX [Methylovulum sp.]MCF8007789.1 EF-P lysine aminoacylase GenX [Methylovulum sp.]
MSNSWRPSCSTAQLHQRAQLFQQIRAFFAERQVLEVETPLLGNHCGTDPHLDFFTTTYNSPPTPATLYLQTSPEFAMKRLVAAGSGDIYQLCKAFRNNESGRFHNPEFTLLEWYRLGFTLTMLMDEIDELFAHVFHLHPLNPSQRLRYQDIFYHYTQLDPLHFCYASYCDYARSHKITEAISLCQHSHSLWLDFIFSHKVQPHLGSNALCMVYDYPACQAALARLNPSNPRCAERVELFINGIELGNGYFELTQAPEQRQRFEHDLHYRQTYNLPTLTLDERLLAALQAGLPDCSGMAIGIDRVLMVLTNTHSLDDILAFPVSRA